MTRDLKTFRNPTGYWEHKGAFSVELIDEADKSIVPSTAKVNGNIVTVRDGRIKQTIAGIQMYSKEQPFYWGYSRIKVIKDGKGNPIWVNYDYRQD